VNGNADYDGADLIDAGNGDMVVVNFNYRVGPYGFLAGKEVAENKIMSMNNGLRDQRKLLEWVQKHIHEVCSCKLFSSTLLTRPVWR
jgi:carboxylesterase type B